MKRKSLLLLPTLLLMSACGPKSTYVDKVDTNILNDDYRNWYEIFVGSFCDSDGDKMGDLKGVESKLDYIKESGYNGIWLMPIFTSPSYHKYNTLNYYEIDPNYGTVEDLQSLIKECHKRDIKIILDLVINHSSRTCEYFQKSQLAHAKKLKGEVMSEEDLFYEDFYTWGPKDIPQGYSGAYALGQVFSVESNFNDDMPEFNFDSENAKDTLKGIAKHYLEMGVDGFRLDAVKYFYLDRSDKNAAVLKEFHDFCKTINEDVFFVGECWSDANTIEKYYAGSDQESFFWFPGASGNGDIMGSINLHGQMLSRYTMCLQEMVEKSHGHIPAPFLDNHDMPRSAKKNVKVTKFLRGLLHMMNGGTWTYYGDEIGLNGFNPPDMNVRKYMNWTSDLDAEGMCKSPAGASKEEYLHAPLDKQMNDPNSIYHYEKKALLQRNRIPAIARGTLGDIEEFYEDGFKNYCVIHKEYEGEKIAIVINFSDKARIDYDLANTAYKELEGRLAVDINDNVEINGTKITLPPYGIAIIK